MTATDNNRLGDILALGTLLLMGLYTIWARGGVRVLDPLAFGGLASTAAGLLLIGVSPSSAVDIWRRKRVVLPHLLAVAFFTTMLAGGLFFIGTRLSSATNASLLRQTEPVYATIFGWLMLGERVRPKMLLPMAMVMLGSASIVYRGTWEVNVGDILLLVAPMGSIIGFALTKKAYQLLSPMQITIGRSLIGGLGLLTASAIFETPTLEEVQASGWWLLAHATVGVAATTLIWNHAIARISLARATTLIAPAPALTMLFAALILDEVQTTWHFGGLVAILGGTFWLLSSKETA